MTREEAIKNLKWLLECSYVDDFLDTENEALDMAIKALEQEPCEDAISREDARMMLTCEIKDGMTITDYIKMVDKRLRQLPSVTPKEKTGHWIVETDCEGKTRTCTCDNCGYTTGRYTWKNPNYCANCGARMESEDKE